MDAHLYKLQTASTQNAVTRVLYDEAHGAGASKVAAALSQDLPANERIAMRSTAPHTCMNMPSPFLCELGSQFLPSSSHGAEKQIAALLPKSGIRRSKSR